MQIPKIPKGQRKNVNHRWTGNALGKRNIRKSNNGLPDSIAIRHRHLKKIVIFFWESIYRQFDVSKC